MSESQVEKQEYLDSLSEINRQNLGLLTSCFLEYCHENKLVGAMLVVGGSVKPDTRGTERKDIDMIPLITGRDSFEEFSELMKYLEDKTGFKIGQVIEPAIDEEFGIPTLLKHTGSISLQPDKGTPLEFIRLESVEDWKEIEVKMSRDTRHFSQLVSSD